MNDEDELNEGRRLGLTVLPPHSQNNNCHNFPQLPAEILNEGGWVRQAKKTHGYFLSLAQGLTISPTLILVKIMPLSHFSFRNPSWSGSFN